ncbi:MAG: hypothetical protein LAN71_07280 [Acidobacteriia bacterium]|nr:hypothetical protein [Terriglobia bacterium]
MAYPAQGAERRRVVNSVSTGGTTQEAAAGQPASVERLRQSAAVASLTAEGSTAPASGSA